MLRRSSRVRKATAKVAQAVGESEKRSDAKTPDTTSIGRRLTKSKSKKPIKKVKVESPVTDEVPPVEETIYEPIRFNKYFDNPILNNLRDTTNKQTPSTIDKEILDNIALEGLSGIKYEYLLNILDAILIAPKFITCENHQLYVWNALIRYLQKPIGSGVRAYVNDTKSKNSTRTDDKGVFIDKPIKTPSLSWKRISKSEITLHPVQDGDIMGSCYNYLERVDITKDLVEKFSRLADQELRRKAIFPDWTDPNVNVKLREYTCLEFIGRTRSFGAIFPNDKVLGRYRIMLSSKGFISQYQQRVQSHIIHHIKRFSQTNLVNIDDKTFNKRGILPNETNLNMSLRPLIKRHCCHPRRLRTDNDMMRMVYDIIAQRDGRSSLDIRRKLKIPRSHIRNHLKNLVNIELVGSLTKRVDDYLLRLYRVRYNSIKLKRQRIENAQELKDKASKWDEIDIKAKSILGKKRSSFTQAEDSFLILCRIISLLIEPNLRKVSYCVDKHFVRNLLHEEFVSSHDKTSNACLRRMKFLRRIPQNVMSINELTAEMREDFDINQLIQSPPKTKHGDNVRNQLFVQLMHIVRGKLPKLLGLPATSIARLNTLHRMSIGLEQETRSSRISIIDYDDLKARYELVDCQSKVTKRPTFDIFDDDVSKNISIVTIASTLMSGLDFKQVTSNDEANPPTSMGLSSKSVHTADESMMLSHDMDTANVSQTGVEVIGAIEVETTKVGGEDTIDGSKIVPATNSHEIIDLNHLNKFYSSHDERVVKSVLGKMNKNSLLTRPVIIGRQLKLNQNVLVALSRYQSNSFMQLAHPMNFASTHIDLKECNDMNSIAKLTSLFSRHHFDLCLKVPTNVVDYDEALSDPMIVQPCNTNFRLDEQEDSIEDVKAIFDEFIAKSQPLEAMNEDRRSKLKSSNIVVGFKLTEESLAKLQHEGREFQHNKGQADKAKQKKFDPNQYKYLKVEYEARIWKSTDGSIQLKCLVKLIESLLSCIIVFPGIELRVLCQEYCHIMPKEHLIELLQLMEALKLISSTKIEMHNMFEPRLFGYVENSRSETITTFEPRENSYLQYCSLLDFCKT